MNWRELSTAELTALPTSFWLSLPPEERIEAVELLRRRYCGAAYDKPLDKSAIKIVGLHDDR